ncbi:MAG: PCMD domain-containing protein [Paramuribaculum sp.]|nr:PCMD domain-containing protein [Paramuribaculum sp.]
MYTSNSKRFKFIPLISSTALALIAALFTSCIEDDIPYPHIQPNILAIEAQGQERAALIDSLNRTVTLYLSEAADIQKVRLTSLSITPGATVADTAAIEAGLNLTQPYEMGMSLYYDYTWTITAQQTIERYFSVRNQIGASEIDPVNHTVNAVVPSTLPLTQIEVLTMKLGGTTATMAPDLVGKTVDFTEPLGVIVSEFGRSQDWVITITQTDVPVAITQIDAWTQVAWVYAAVEEGHAAGFEYRLTGVDQWTQVPSSWITQDGGTIKARLSGLFPSCDYEIRAYSGDVFTLPSMFTTMGDVQLPNSSFENWWKDGRIWCPWAQDGEKFWDTGNKGATTLGESNTQPVVNSESPTGYLGARLESKFVGISVLGKLAAGNLFAGDYVRTEGTNGVLSFGRPFSNFPTKVSGTIDYTSVQISHASSGMTSMVGQPDTCIIWCALADWENPFEIRTNPSNRHLFSPDDPGVIAYGQMQSGVSTGGMVPFEFELNYNATDRIPRWILLVCSASKYGDYFTGGSGSVLIVEHLQLEYDY